MCQQGKKLNACQRALRVCCQEVSSAVAYSWAQLQFEFVSRPQFIRQLASADKTFLSSHVR